MLNSSCNLLNTVLKVKIIMVIWILHVLFLPNVYAFHTTVKLKNHKLDHRRAGTVCNCLWVTPGPHKLHNSPATADYNLITGLQYVNNWCGPLISALNQHFWWTYNQSSKELKQRSLPPLLKGWQVLHQHSIKLKTKPKQWN